MIAGYFHGPLQPFPDELHHIYAWENCNMSRPGWFRQLRVISVYSPVCYPTVLRNLQVFMGVPRQIER
jgi:hypothetical protein